MKYRQSIFLLLAAFTACQRDAGPAVAADSVASDEAKSSGIRAFGRVGNAAPPRLDISAPEEAQARGEVQATSGVAPGADPFQSFTMSAGAQPMIIRTGQAFIEVEKVDPAILKIRQLSARVGGYIANSSVSGGRDQIRQATLELKIPSTQYEQALGDLSSIGKVETVSSNAQDVGEEFVDITARANNSKKLEDRLINLLANRTGKLDEVLRVERELARVREEIERYEGRLRYLSSRAAMSTLSITIHEPAPILGNDPGSNPIIAALRRAWRNFVGLVAGLIASLGVLIPLALVGWGLWIAYKRWRHK
jgi:hypothetical protein